ncbi:MAG: APC family permease [Cyanobacteria bacterium SZAS LIN-2]|nr:APC family permease [Cyanobacteria bacterium SZAS LIN-2]
MTPPPTINSISAAGEEAREHATPQQRAKTSSRNYGLASSILSSTETFAQSIAGIAPTATPAITVAIVFSMAGGGAWLAYGLATGIMILTAASLSIFASRQSSPGSLYTYARGAGGHFAGFITGWAMLFAYVLGVTGGSVQFAVFAEAFLQNIGIHGVSSLTLMAICLLGTTVIAYKNVKLSAELMLWMEILSIGIILYLVCQLLAHHGLQPDLSQLRLSGSTPQGFGLGLVMALLAFVGFESAATLGSEADKPLERIPQTLMRSVILSGIFFVLSTYAIVQGFHDLHLNLDNCTTPLAALSNNLGMQWLAVLTSLGAAASLFAATLAANTAAARIMLTMSHDGYLHGALKKVHPTNHTPVAAILTVAACALLFIVLLLAMSARPMDIVGWLGTLATYSFILAYSLVSALVPKYLRSRGELKPRHRLLSIIASTTMIGALLATIIPLPPAPYCYLPFICLAYFAAGVVHFRASCLE